MKMERRILLVTIKEIAAKANVSLTTASIVLSNRSSSIRISEKTKKKVLDTAAALGYLPNLSARQLRQTGENVLTLALIMPIDSRVSIMGEILLGVQQYLTSPEVPLSCALIVETHNPGRIEDIKGLFVPSRFNGAIAANLSADDQQLLHRSEVKVPCVLLHRESEMFPYADANNFAAGQLAAAHFLRNGHRELVILAPRISSDAIQKRVEGILNELSLQPGNAVRHILIECEFSEEGGYEAGKRLLASQGTPTAVVCLCFPLAVGVLSAMHEAGVAIPRQCEVIGFDNKSSPQYTIPKLSTVDIPIGQMARQAAKMLVNLILNPNAPQDSVTFDVQLVHRETTRLELDTIG